MGLIKKIITEVRERRLGSKALRRLDKDDRQALISLGLTALFCVIERRRRERPASGLARVSSGAGEYAMSKFRKKPVVIDAMQFFPPEGFAPGQTIGGVHHSGCSDNGEAMYTVRTLEGHMQIRPGEWLITGIKGELYPCRPDIFEATYEPVSEAE
jgi:hypothetical protein